MKTIADILRERNARISEGGYWMVWTADAQYADEDCWQIYKAERGKGVLVFRTLTNLTL